MLRFGFRKNSIHSELFNRENRHLIIRINSPFKMPGETQTASVKNAVEREAECAFQRAGTSNRSKYFVG
ncbi:MAG: hypothetical protein JXB48_03975 [Candidatus Latescibacteria bacterium]|nr:hypothetical protein [Candidatus Latescibacterota bacterium]